MKLTPEYCVHEGWPVYWEPRKEGEDANKID